MVDKNYTDCPSSRENFKRKNLIWSKINGKHCYGYNNCCFIAGKFFPTAHALIGYFEVT